ncbi:RDD family protein [Gulosibacter molinativorax]|uniref:RDD family protein n=1 Tax=Gulosibacter molinativorax TaxID=256821 RepID=A0ABT7C9Y1_9MICO|nr:RDD family protein [Gulosibacter molinativorax]MDJ1372003.1 RDD family protein [Gulosibacter molinativorax]QUY62631.1 Putative integral membrane protein [Gulosibacter molinativorax]
MTTLATTGSTTHDDEDVVIGEGVALGVPAAGFLSRAGSATIDVIVIMLGYVLSVLALAWLLEMYILATGIMIEDAWLAVIQVIWLVLWTVLVPVIVETLSHGRSLGKLIFGLRIVRDDGGAIGFRHALIRGLVGLLELYLSLGAVALLAGLFNPRAKRLGDMLAGTYAQLERVKRPAPHFLQLPPILQGWAQVADVSRLPDRTARRMHDFFLQAPKLDPRARVQLAGVIAREIRPYVHPVPDVDAETFLVGVSVLRRDRELQGIVGRQTRVERLTSAVDQLPHNFPYRG